jgi:hypothetical protein
VLPSTSLVEEVSARVCGSTYSRGTVKASMVDLKCLLLILRRSRTFSTRLLSTKTTGPLSITCPIRKTGRKTYHLYQLFCPFSFFQDLFSPFQFCFSSFLNQPALQKWIAKSYLNDLLGGGRLLTLSF